MGTGGPLARRWRKINLPTVPAFLIAVLLRGHNLWFRLRIKSAHAKPRFFQLNAFMYSR